MNGGGAQPGYTEVADDEDLTSTKANDNSASGNGASGNSASGGGHTSTQPPDPAWPKLAQAAYHGLAGEVVARLLPNTESDPAALLLQYLTSFGNAVGRQPYYLVERTRHFGNLFVVLVGSTAKARKGTAAERVRTILEVADRDWADNRTRGGASSGEGVIWAVRDPIFSLKKGQMVLTDEGVTDKRLLLDEREFFQPLAVMQREGNILSRVFRDAYDCGRVLATLTKNSPARATEAFISIIGHITLDELRDMLDRTSMANGFANRFLFACVRRSKLLPDGGAPDDEAAGKLGAATLEALNAARKRERICMTDAAAQHWRQIYPQLSREQPGLFGAVVARAEAQTIRLALIYALLDSAPQINRNHLDAALAVWSFCEASAQYVFGDLLGDPVADTILRLLRNSGTVGMTRSEISNAFGRNTAVSKIDAALGKLQAVNKIYYQTRKTGGRSAQVWFAR
jgi:hypothetical protein